ncbi:MAG: MFS transporter [Candidatus Hadarchaeum sp.]|uniref:MFS transporter n=1 Tax=Candidatus Hadarchaeum sp. TaxID=2883567 RepID=UPI0031790CFC
MAETILDYLEKAPLSRFHYMLLLVGSLIYGFTAMNVLLIAAVLTPIIKEFGLGQQPLISGLLLSAGYLGMFVGAFVCGILADRIGRKRTLLFTITTMSVFTALNSLAPDPATMALLRFLAGVGLGGSLPQPGVYVSEYIPAKYRGRFLGLVETAWVYGALLSLIFPFFLFPAYGWRATFLVALLPLSLLPVVAFFTPESLRYLQLKGKAREALGVLKKYKIVPSDFSEPKLPTIYPQRYSFGAALKGLWSRNYRRRTALLWILWAVLVYTYHGIFIWLPTFYASPPLNFTVVKSIQWVLIVTLAQVPGYYSAAMLLDRVGRKPIALIYLAFAGVGSVLLSFAVEPTSILLWSLVISFFNLGAWSALYAYTPELYPTGIRGTGSGAAASIGRIAGVIAPTATPLLYAYGGLAAAFAVFSLMHFLGAVAVAVLGIETKGKVLEEIAKE